jgi:predicted HTH domain antitoxin
MYKTGFNNDSIQSLLNDPHSASMIKSFGNLCAYFEKAKSSKGLYKVQDGITRDAIFCLRDILRELPVLLVEDEDTFISADKFINIIKSQYASKQDLKLTSWRKERIRKFQSAYKDLLNRAAKLAGKPVNALLHEMAERSALINRYQRVTGDAVIYVASNLIRNRRKLTSEELHHVFTAFVGEQILIPENVVNFDKPMEKVANTNSKKVYENMLKIVKECREGI